MKIKIKDTKAISELSKKLFFAKSFCCLGRSLSRCLDCKYCRLLDNSSQGFDFSVLPGEVNPAFRTLPVAVNLFYGDPLIQIDHTLKILENLERDEHSGPVIVITKGDFRKFPKRDFNLDLHFAFSTFGKDHQLDGGSIKTFLNNLKEAAKFSKYRYSIEFRPIICDVNDDEATLDFVMRTASEYGLAVGYSGLQGKPAIAEQWNKEKLNLRPYPGYKFGYKKMIADDKERSIAEAAERHNVPIFKKTSCLISYTHGLERDYNAHYFRPNEVRCHNCPMEKKCSNYHDNLGKIIIPKKLIPFKYEIIYKEDHECILKKNGLCEFPTADCSRISGHLIKIDEKLTTADVRVIKWLTGMTVDADFEESPYINKVWAR